LGIDWRLITRNEKRRQLRKRQARLVGVSPGVDALRKLAVRRAQAAKENTKSAIHGHFQTKMPENDRAF
jgi:hypothetical protein